MITLHQLDMALRALTAVACEVDDLNMARLQAGQPFDEALRATVHEWAAWLIGTAKAESQIAKQEGRSDPIRHLGRWPSAEWAIRDDIRRRDRWSAAARSND